jgi:hypothetical protein
MPDRNRVIAALKELIAALDRRVPQVKRVGEERIAQEAATLRRDAVARIGELEGTKDSDSTAK